MMIYIVVETLLLIPVMLQSPVLLLLPFPGKVKQALEEEEAAHQEDTVMDMATDFSFLSTSRTRLWDEVVSSKDK